MTLGLWACGEESSRSGAPAGDAAPADDAVAAAPPDPGVHAWVIVIDVSDEPAASVTYGADICGLAADCGGQRFLGVEARLSRGDGELCDGVREGCSADRTDPTAALDDGADCEPASAPSDYVSLGLGGVLSVRFSRGLAGCRLTVEELEGNQLEGYEVFVCADPMGVTTCLRSGDAVGRVDRGGSVTVELPRDTPTGPLSWLILRDRSYASSERGTSGADICRVAARCPEGAVEATDAVLHRGDGALCDAPSDACTADRTDPQAVLDASFFCEVDSVPSDYVSLGRGGSLAVDYGRSLAGCTVRIEALRDAEVDLYDVLVCDDPDAVVCLHGRVLARAEGSLELTIP